ncbi:MAG TPA: SCP2 sterol-binding domain-containing protein [Acidimicrobiales bacterium]|nr:SCP2 sterol-binding domain-containing protein [Acidimicrobiales bacterium]
MARYLSEEWFAVAAAMLGPAPDAATAAGGEERPDEEPLVVEQRVLDGPEGPVVWHVVVAGAVRSIQPGPHPSPTVAFSQDYTTAAAVASGELSAQEAFMTGRITMSGDAGALLAAAPALAGVGDALAAVREDTSF